MSEKPHLQAVKSSNEAQEIAEAFVTARLQGRSLKDYPGNIPADLASAYVIQDEAIAMWPDSIIGWKVGRITGDNVARLGADRLAGPIFKTSVQHSSPGEVIEFPVFVGGFAAVEAELILQLGESAPADKLEWTLQEAKDLVGDVFFGIETACSPLPTINALGPTVIVSDFGNNAGLILAGPFEDWRHLTGVPINCVTHIEDQLVGEASTELPPQGPFESLRFLLELSARRGRPLQAGDFISSGAITGVHDILPGQSSVVKFGDLEVIKCHAKPLTVKA